MITKDEIKLLCRAAKIHARKVSACSENRKLSRDEIERIAVFSLLLGAVKMAALKNVPFADLHLTTLLEQVSKQASLIPVEKLADTPTTEESALMKCDKLGFPI